MGRMSREERKKRTCIECGREVEELGVCFRCVDCCEKVIDECWRYNLCSVGRRVLMERLRRVKFWDEDDGYPD